ncbi:hypothetical protein GCM10023333_00020 [Ferrimonas pelagia]|uniref:Uncharacterized protein n=1 Tax=Ferrimonas pelagia TaxID=1177826 RepID=A0ABP9E836_9GAMM
MLLQHPQYPNMGRPFGPATGQDKSDLRSRRDVWLLRNLR